MAIDGYFINQQIKEFKPLLENSKVRKISGESKYQIIFSLYNKGVNYFLLLDISPNSPHFRLKENSINKYDSTFLESLKSALLNSTLVGLSQHLKDRTIFLDFLKHDPFLGGQNYRLVFEIMGRNTNLILTNQDNLILTAFNKRFNEDKRSILPNVIYEVFPTTKKEFTQADFSTLLDADELFYNYLGFSKQLAQHIYLTKTHPNDLEIKPTLYKNQKIEFHYFDLNLEGEKIVFENTSTLLEYYYKTTLRSDDYLITVLKKEFKKQQQKLINLTEELQTNQNYDLYKQLADQIYSSSLNLKAKYQEFNGQPLNQTLSLNENAQSFYRKYRKLKNSLTHIEEQLQLTNNLITYLNDNISIYPTLEVNELDELKEELISLSIIREKKKRKTTTKNPVYKQFNLNNGLCLVGKTLKQNELIYAKANNDDLWFHIKDYPGAHVILKGEKSQENILFAAKQAIINSPVKGTASTEVIYTYIRNTKRIKNKPGFYIIFSKEKSIYPQID